MQILIIRHGDPNYELDCLTEKGKREAELLAQRLKKENISKIYCSPYGRAKETAAPSAEILGIKPEILDFLSEITSTVPDKFTGENKHGWTLHPLSWTSMENVYDKDRWMTSKPWSDTDIPKIYENICKQTDSLIAGHGYVRDGDIYRFNSFSKERIALFCHQGAGTAIISHLMQLSLPHVWNTMFIAPSSVTRIVLGGYNSSNGISVPRLIALGDTSHLYTADEKISFIGIK